jgi:methionyl-tRNA synthetase
MNTVLYVTLEVLRTVAVLAQPVMPGSAGQLLTVLGQGTSEDDAQRTFAALATALEPGTQLPAPTPIFPKYEEPAEG